MKVLEVYQLSNSKAYLSIFRQTQPANVNDHLLINHRVFAYVKWNFQINDNLRSSKLSENGGETTYLVKLDTKIPRGIFDKSSNLITQYVCLFIES